MRASADNRESRQRLLSARNTSGLRGVIELHGAVIFGSDRSRSRQDHIGKLSEGVKHRLVGRTTESARSTIDFDRPIDAGDHIHHDPGANRQSSPNIGRDRVHRVEVGTKRGKELIHMATLGVELPSGDRCCGQLWIIRPSSTDYPPMIHRQFTANTQGCSPSNPQA